MKIVNFVSKQAYNAGEMGKMDKDLPIYFIFVAKFCGG